MSVRWSGLAVPRRSRLAVAGVAEVITTPGFVNVDFADVRTVMSLNGMAMMGALPLWSSFRTRLEMLQEDLDQHIGTWSAVDCEGGDVHWRHPRGYWVAPTGTSSRCVAFDRLGRVLADADGKMREWPNADEAKRYVDKLIAFQEAN